MEPLRSVQACDGIGLPLPLRPQEGNTEHWSMIVPSCSIRTVTILTTREAHVTYTCTIGLRWDTTLESAATYCYKTNPCVTQEWRCIHFYLSSHFHPHLPVLYRN
jgi:hypothetical protein